MTWTEKLNDLRFELFGPDKQPYEKALKQYRLIEKRLEKALKEIDYDMKEEKNIEIEHMKDEMDTLARLIHNADKNGLNKYDVKNVPANTNNRRIRKQKS